MDSETFEHIFNECAEFRARLCGGFEQTPENMLMVASCLLRQVEIIHEAVGGPQFNATLLRQRADRCRPISHTKGIP